MSSAYVIGALEGGENGVEKKKKKYLKAEKWLCAYDT